jgi:hypothetical protein
MREFSVQSFILPVRNGVSPRHFISTSASRTTVYNTHFACKSVITAHRSFLNAVPAKGGATCFDVIRSRQVIRGAALMSCALFAVVLSR